MDLIILEGYYFIIMGRSRTLLNLLTLITLALFCTQTHAYSCSTAMNNNWLTAYSWENCYQAGDQNIIGSSVGSLGANNYWGHVANWDYDYNNWITFIYHTGAWQRWNYRNHNTGTCRVGSNCNCGSPNHCYNYRCDDCCYCCDTDWEGNQYCWWCGCSCCFYTYDYNYYNDDQVYADAYRPCHPYCLACTSIWDRTACSTCRESRTGSGAAVYGYKWNNFPDRSYSRCDYYCPNDAN